MDVFVTMLLEHKRNFGLSMDALYSRYSLEYGLGMDAALVESKSSYEGKMQKRYFSH